MLIQYVNNLKDIEYKQSDIIFCYLKDTKEQAETIFDSNLVSYLTSLSTNLNCLIFSYFTLCYNNKEPNKNLNEMNAKTSYENNTIRILQPTLNAKQNTQERQSQIAETTIQLIMKQKAKQAIQSATNGAVAIISNGTLIDIYEEGDIETKFNLSTYQTRLGKVAILINNDIYSPNIFYALKSLPVDLAITFTNTPLSPDIFAQSQSLPLISITPKSIT